MSFNFPQNLIKSYRREHGEMGAKPPISADFDIKSPLSRHLADIERQCHRQTIPRAKCVNDRTEQYSPGHNTWGLGPPKKYCLLILTILAVSRELIYQPFATGPPLYGTSGRVGQTPHRGVSQGHNVWGLGPPKCTFCSDFTKIASSRKQMAGSSPNLHRMLPGRACIHAMLKVKFKVKGHVTGTLL